MEILPNVHIIPNAVSNQYLLIDPDGLTLIDAGMPGSHRKALSYLAGLGYKPEDLKRILITHADFDHVGGLAAIKAATGAHVFASPVEAQAMAGRFIPPGYPRPLSIWVAEKALSAWCTMSASRNAPSARFTNQRKNTLPFSIPARRP